MPPHTHGMRSVCRSSALGADQRRPDSPLPDVLVEAELRFDGALPYAACLAFPLTPCGCTGSDAKVCWYFSRDLLNEGRHSPAGDGHQAPTRTRRRSIRRRPTPD